jgi:hypothetical protein
MEGRPLIFYVVALAEAELALKRVELDQVLVVTAALLCGRSLRPAYDVYHATALS